MKGKDEIKDLFSDKLGNFEAPVRPDLWTNIASQIGTGVTSTASTGLSLLTKTMIGLGIGAAVVTTVIVMLPETESKPSKNISENTFNNNNNNERPVINEKQDDSNQNIKPERQKPVVLEDNREIVKSVETTEIDPNQNFKTDISLIEALKERKENGFIEKKEETVKKEAQKETPKVTEDKNADTKQSSKTVTESKKIEQKKPVKTYTLGDLPNIFTPNSDGNNDFLFIESEGLEDFTIVVLDSKQKVVFESNDPNFKWNGVDKFGNTVTAGTYGYYIIARDSNGNKVNRFVALEIRF